MTGFLDNDATFDDGTSLGFTPHTATPASSIDLPSLDSGGGDASVAEQAGFRETPGGFNLAAAGLNLATPQPKPTLSDQEYLQGLPTMQKIGLALQAFSAGVAGRASPINQLLHERRQEETQKLHQLSSNLSIAKAGLELMDRFDEGSLQQKAVAADLSAKAPHLASLFNAPASERSKADPVLNALENPLAKKMVMDNCSAHRGAKFNACLIETATDTKKMELIYKRVDTSLHSQIVDKAEAAIKANSGTDPETGQPRVLEKYRNKNSGNLEIPERELRRLAGSVFSKPEVDALGRNEDWFVELGVIPIKTAAAVQKTALNERAKQAEKPTNEWSEPYMLNGVLVQKNSVNNEIRQAVSREPRAKEDRPDKQITPAQVIADTKTQNIRDRLDDAGLSPDWTKKRTPEDTAKFNVVMKKYEDELAKDTGQKEGEIKKKIEQLKMDWRQGWDRKMYADIAEERAAAKAGREPPDVERNRAAGKRADGSAKGTGFLGELRAKDGRTSTEISIGVNIGGKEMEIPTLVPTLTTAEKNSLLNGERPSNAIVDKAVAHAKQRIADGKPVFAQAGEGPAAKAGTLSAADRQKALDAATAAVNGGADAEAVKKRLKEKYGIEVTFGPAKKK